MRQGYLDQERLCSAIVSFFFGLLVDEICGVNIVGLGEYITG